MIGRYIKRLHHKFIQFAIAKTLFRLRPGGPGTQPADQAIRLPSGGYSFLAFIFILMAQVMHHQ